MSELADLVAESRAVENETHTDTCGITRPSIDPPTWTPDGGTVPAAPTTIYASLPCRLRSPSASDRAAVAGEHQFAEGDSVLRLAAGTTGIRIGDTVTMLTSPQGVGTDGTFTVMWPISGSHMSSARFIVRQVA